MREFNKEYFFEIWPDAGARRIDYCQGLSKEILKKVGKCKILDVGCSGGGLVQELRKLGFEAWGIDISEYAISKSFCPDYCFVAGCDKIPFPSKSFDLVFSNGLFEYIRKEDLPKVFKELKRVGEKQYHRIDTKDDYWSKDFETAESIGWWMEVFEKNQINNLEWNEKNINYEDKILIATPVSDEKEYCFQEWINAIKNLDYSNKEYLVIDNSSNLDFYNRYHKQINMININLDGLHFNKKIAFCMEEIRKYFLSNEDLKLYFNVEADVILPPETIRVMLKCGGGFDWDWNSVNYPSRQNPKNMMSGFGATMFSRNIMSESFLGNPSDGYTDAFFWNQVILPSPKKYKTVETWNFLNVKHE